jgi:hypothetical protein
VTVQRRFSESGSGPMGPACHVAVDLREQKKEGRLFKKIDISLDQN